MKKYFLLIMSFSFCYMSCSDQKKKNDEVVTSPETVYAEDFNNSAKINALSERTDLGDTSAYKDLKKIYMYSGHKRDFLRNSLAMGENFQYPEAYLDTYFILKTDSINSINKNINVIANFFLLKAYENGAKYARNSLKERFDSFKLPSSKQYAIDNNIINYK